MSPLRKIFASLLIVGMVTAGGVACSSDDSSDSAASTEAWCNQFKAMEDADVDLELDESAKMIEDLAKNAPGAVRDDMNLLATAFTELSAVDFEDAEAVAAVEEKYDEDKIDAATSRIEAFVKDKCGIDVDADEE